MGTSTMGISGDRDRDRSVRTGIADGDSPFVKLTIRLSGPLQYSSSRSTSKNVNFVMLFLWILLRS
jgi:hypothetical protein